VLSVPATHIGVRHAKPILSCKDWVIARNAMQENTVRIINVYHALMPISTVLNALPRPNALSGIVLVERR